MWEELAEPLLRLSTRDWAIVLGATVTAGLVRGFSGFGTALVMVPPLSLVFGPTVAIPIMSLVDLPGTLGLIPNAVRRAAWREVAPASLGAAICLPFGVYVLIVADQEILRWVMSAMILLLVALLASGWRYGRRPTPPVSAGVGSVAGLMGGAVGVPGPPVILFWLGSRADAAVVRANIIIFLAILTVTSYVSFTVGGLFTRDVFVVAVFLMPVFAASIWLGAHGFRFASERTFRLLALGIIAAIALLSLLG